MNKGFIMCLNVTKRPSIELLTNDDKASYDQIKSYTDDLIPKADLDPKAKAHEVDPLKKYKRLVISDDMTHLEYKEVSWFYRVLACIGIGKANLKNVINFIKEKKTLYAVINENRMIANSLDERIDNFINQRFWINRKYLKINVPDKIFNDLPNLQRVLGLLTPLKKKLAELSMKRFMKLGCNSKEMKTFRLGFPEDFVLNAKEKPTYFNDLFKVNNSKQTKFECDDKLYTYEKESEGYKGYWVDFANCYLGGGCFEGNSWAQEEQQDYEFPECGEHIAETLGDRIKTRSKILVRAGVDPEHQDEVYQGTPTPYLMNNVSRVIEVSSRIYGGKFQNVKLDDLESHVTNLNEAQKTNLLAIAAPKLDTRNLIKQTDLRTVEDLFNTVMAGFTLAKAQAAQENKDKKCLIHSGKLGCGEFSNNVIVVYLVQRLAAEHLGIDLKLHAYTTEEANLGDQIWQTICSKFGEKEVKESKDSKESKEADSKEQKIKEADKKDSASSSSIRQGTLQEYLQAIVENTKNSEEVDKTNFVGGRIPKKDKEGNPLKDKNGRYIYIS